MSRIAVVLVLAGCRPGLPPTPPQEDPASAEAPIPAWEASASAFEGSAFEGEKLDEGGHAGHAGHAGHGPKMAPPKKTSAEGDHAGHGAKKAAPEPAQEPDGGGHAGHGAKKAAPEPADEGARGGPRP